MKPKQVANELLGVYQKSSEEYHTSRGDINRIKSIRPSQLPFCAVGTFVQVASQGTLRTMDMQGAFYTEVGSAVHNVVQKYLGRSGRFLATWQCMICRKVHKVTTKNECCDFPMRYEEIQINHKGVIGHIDAVFQDSLGRYWILDFKTTSVKRVVYKIKSPGAAYKAQVRAYALMLWLQYGIRVAGVMLMFIRRDNPADPAVWVKPLDKQDFKDIMVDIKKAKADLKAVLNVETLADALALSKRGRCKNDYCRTCKSSLTLKEQLKKAYKKGKAAGRLPLRSLQ